MREIARQILRFLKYPYWGLVNLAYGFGLLRLTDIPIIINNFNRITFPLRLLDFLEGCGFLNIIILDNNSTYPPLLQYYATCKYQVVRETTNHGQLALWKSGLYRKYRWNYFVYTDPDVLPISECPKDFIHHFKRLLVSNLKLDKIGFGIKIDDLPGSFSLKEKIVTYEKQYWKREVSPNVFDAPIDTTFALYRPLSNTVAGASYTMRAFRTGFPYMIRHLPWYEDSARPTEEDEFYRKTCNESSSLGQQQIGTRTIY